MVVTRLGADYVAPSKKTTCNLLKKTSAAVLAKILYTVFLYKFLFLWDIYANPFANFGKL
jgi:hypothetical protein